ncbi:phenylalanine--tRNA ligase, putative [Plasmodium ovale wallikeri]|nr:phenylalanine--tRNA ligase, putative [Plasmodium ovale wallikeri]
MALLPQIVLSNEGRTLYKILNHPIRTIKNMIELFFFHFEKFDNLKSETSVKENFDDLFVPLVHPARNAKDTFYLDKNYIKNYYSYLQYCYSPFDKINPFYKYYLANKLLCHDKIKLKRTHMTTHLPDLLRKNHKNVIYTGTVYRRDEIDKYHFPIFHQTDGFLIQPQSFHVESDLKTKLEQLVYYLFGKKQVEMKWEHDTSFPFTDPSYELYIRGESRESSVGNGNADSSSGSDGRDSRGWVEILGCGKIKKEVIALSLYEKDINRIIEGEITLFDKELMSAINKYSYQKETDQQQPYWEWQKKSSLTNNLCNTVLNNRIEIKINAFLKTVHHEGWAFGIGLERLAMLLYDIHDIRLFWSKDKRFINQFKENEISLFIPFSNFPSVQKDISFYLNDKFKESAFFQICRDIAHENIEEVKKIDSYYNPKTKETSVCYRITYRSHNQNLTHKIVNDIQKKIVQVLIKECSVIIR